LGAARRYAAGAGARPSPSSEKPRIFWSAALDGSAPMKPAATTSAPIAAAPAKRVTRARLDAPREPS